MQHLRFLFASPSIGAQALRRAPLITRSFSSHASILQNSEQRIRSERHSEHSEKPRLVFAQKATDEDVESPSSPQGINNASSNNQLQWRQLSELTAEQLAAARENLSIFDVSTHRHFEDKHERVDYLYQRFPQWFEEFALELEALASSEYTPSSAPEFAERAAKLCSFCRYAVNEFFVNQQELLLVDTDYVLRCIFYMMLQSTLKPFREHIEQVHFWNTQFQNYFAVLDRLSQYQNQPIQIQGTISVIMKSVGFLESCPYWCYQTPDAVSAFFQQFLQIQLLEPSHSKKTIRDGLSLDKKMRLCCMLLGAVLKHKKHQNHSRFIRFRVLPIVSLFEHILATDALPMIQSSDTPADLREDIASSFAAFSNIMLNNLQDEAMPFEQRLNLVQAKLQEASELGIKMDTWRMVLNEIVIQLEARGDHEKLRSILPSLKGLSYPPLVRAIVSALPFAEALEYYKTLPIELQQNGMIIFGIVTRAYTLQRYRHGIVLLVRMMQECEKRGSYQWPTPFTETTAGLEKVRKTIDNYKRFASSRHQPGQLCGLTEEEFVKGVDALLAAEEARDDIKRKETKSRKHEHKQE